MTLGAQNSVSSPLRRQAMARPSERVYRVGYSHALMPIDGLSMVKRSVLEFDG